MTPFMHRVRVVAGRGDGDVLAPATRPSVPKPVRAGVAEHVAIRSLAEQLSSEANAVLPGSDPITLVDEAGDGRLSFSLTYRTRIARWETHFPGPMAVAQLSGDAKVTSGPCELDGPEELETVILLLLSDPDKSARQFRKLPGTDLIDAPAS